MADAQPGIEAIALRFCAGGDNELLFLELAAFFKLDDASLRNQSLEFFGLRQLDWKGRETLLIQTISRDVPSLRRSVLVRHGLHDGFETLSRGSIGLAEMKPLITLMEAGVDDEESAWFIQDAVGGLVARLGDAEVQDFCLNSLVSGSPRLREWIKEHYLRGLDGISSDALDDYMIAALLADLNVPNKVDRHWYNPLGYLATEDFVRERLLPLADGASEAFRDNLELVLKVAGDRHGKRYLAVESEEVVHPN